MTALYERKELENRVAELEEKLSRMDKKIRLLGYVVATRVRPWDDPLKNFFDAPEFWEVIYEDQGACYNRCFSRNQAASIACHEDPNCDTAELEICSDECGELGAFPLPI